MGRGGVGSETFIALESQKLYKHRVSWYLQAHLLYWSNEPTMLKELPLIDAGGWSASLERVQQNVNCQEVIQN